jgi:hypothetical protein
MKEQNSTPQRRASTWFDGAVLLANLVLVGPITEWLHPQDNASPLFGSLLLAGLLAYSFGAWLKRRPLQSRLMQQPAWSGWAYLLFLVLGTMHLGLFILAGCLGMEAFPLPEDAAMIGGLLLGLLPTVLAVWALAPPRSVPQDDSRKARVHEALSDTGIWFGTVVLFALWENTLVPEVAGKAGGHALMSILLVTLMTVPFAIFYLAPRLLFLAEDFRKGSTWIRVVLVALPFAWRIATG